MASANSIAASHSDRDQLWISEISKIFEEEARIDIDFRMSIFRVPPELSAFKPNAYVPQLIALGPYHHFCPKLYEMERYKLAAAIRVQKQFRKLVEELKGFKELVEELKGLEHKVRGCYHKYLEMQGEKIAWIMAIDGLFLLLFLNRHVHKDPQPSSEEARLLGNAEKSLGKVAILSDVLMLENQIPIFVLSKIMIFVLSRIMPIQLSDTNTIDGLLRKMLENFCKAASPLNLPAVFPGQILDHAHLLELLYHWTLSQPDNDPGRENGGSSSNSASQTDNDPGRENRGSSSNSASQPGNDPDRENRGSSPNSASQPENVPGRENRGSSSNTASQAHSDRGRENGGPNNFYLDFTGLWNSAFRLLVDILNQIIGRIMEIPGLARALAREVARALARALPPNGEENRIPQSGSTSVVEQITIPSVSVLCTFGVEFLPAKGGIKTIQFNPRDKRFYLPVITLNVHSEVIMRNLVAYEACMSESPVFARYTELMNGIIDTAEDAKLLREKKIIVNNLKSDADVAELFNGMSKAVRRTQVPHMDDAIEKVNNYFYNTGRFRAYACMTKCMYGFLKVLAVLAVFFFLLLSSLESYCSVFGCPRLLHTISSASSKNPQISLPYADM